MEPRRSPRGSSQESQEEREEVLVEDPLEFVIDSNMPSSGRGSDFSGRMGSIEMDLPTETPQATGPDHNRPHMFDFEWHKSKRV